MWPSALNFRQLWVSLFSSLHNFKFAVIEKDKVEKILNKIKIQLKVYLLFL